MDKFFDYKRTAFFGVLYLILFFVFLFMAQIVLAQNEQFTFDYAKKNQLHHKDRVFTFHSEVSDYKGTKYLVTNDREANWGSIEIDSGTFIPLAFEVHRPWGKFDGRVIGFLGDKKVFSQKINVDGISKKIKLKAKSINRITIESLKKYNQIYVKNFEFQLPISKSEPKNKNIPTFILNFEQVQQKFTENNHHFLITSQISRGNASDGFKSWECSNEKGTTGSLKVENGKIEVKSLKIKRPWGDFKAIISGYDGKNLLFSKQVKVESEFSEITLRPYKITHLKIQSLKEFNQLYIDEIEYSFFSMENTSKEVAEVTHIEEVNNPQISEVHSPQNTNLDNPINIPKNEDEELFLDFEHVKLHSSKFQLNGHHFEIASPTSEGHARSGQRAWQANESKGTSGYLRIRDEQFHILSLWIKRPWGKFKAVISGWQNGEKKYEKKVAVCTEYQKVTFKDWRKIDEIRIESLKEFNQIYIDDIAYIFHSENKSKDTVLEEKVHVELIEDNPEKSNLDTISESSIETGLMRGEESLETRDEIPDKNLPNAKILENKTELDPEILQFENCYFGQRFKLAETSQAGLRLAWEILSGSAKLIGTNELEIVGLEKVKLLVSDEKGNSWITDFEIEKADQILQIDPIKNVSVRDEKVKINAKLSSGLNPKIEVILGEAKIKQGELILPQKAGKIALKISHEGNEFYKSIKPVELSFHVQKRSQSIIFAKEITQNLDYAPFEIQASATSGLPIKFEIVSGSAKVEGNTIIPIHSWHSENDSIHRNNNIRNEITVKIYQSGNEEFNSAPEVIKRFYLNNEHDTKKGETGDFEFETEIKKTKGVPPSDISLTNNQIKDNSDKNTLIGKLIVKDTDIEDTHTFQLLNNENGLFKINENNELVLAKSRLNAKKNPSHTVKVRVVDNKKMTFDKEFEITVKDGNTLAQQNIVMDDLEDKIFNAPNFKINVKSTSGLPVHLLVEGAAELLENNEIQLVGTGIIKIIATAKGNDAYASASLTKTFESKKATQSIQIHGLDNIKIDAPPIPLEVSSSSGLPVRFEVEGVAKIENNKLILSKEEGKVTLRAFQDGNELYQSTDTEITFEIKKRTQDIYFQAIEAKTFGQEPFELNANSNSGLPVDFKILAGNATIQDNKVDLTGTGWVKIEASQKGNDIFAPAKSVVREFNIKGLMKIISSLRPRIRRGEVLEVRFNAGEVFAKNNKFHLILSNPEGDFETGTRTLSSISNSNRVFNIKVPSDIPVGTNYRLRIESTAPQIFSAPTPSGVVITYSGKINQNSEESYASRYERNQQQSISIPVEQLLHIIPSMKAGRYTIELNKYDINNLEMIILNHSGDTIFESYYSKIAGYRERVNLSQAPPGNYKVQVTADEQIYVKNFEVR